MDENKRSLILYFMNIYHRSYYFIPLRLFICCLFTLLMIMSCDNDSKEKKTKKKNTEKIYTNPKGYDLSQPILMKLPLELDEISGVAYYPKDTSVIAIQDEYGLLYKIFLNNPQNIQKWKFAKGDDFEDIALLNGVFYVLKSTGNILAVKFITNDSLYFSEYRFPFGGGNEFEILYYDDQQKKLMLICKDCEVDKKKSLSAYSFNPQTTEYNKDSFKVDVTKITSMINEKKMRFKPSAAAIHPVSGDIYIISSINALLVITDKMGNAKEVHRIDRGYFKQPEGITFTPGGTMIISNEAADIGVANIMIFPFKP